MEFLRSVLLVLHLLGFAAIAAGVVSLFAVRTRPVFWRLVVGGTGAVVLTGALLVVARNALDLDVNSAKIGLKLVLALGAIGLFIAARNRHGRRTATGLDPAVRALTAVAAVLAITDFAIAFLWN